MHVLVTFFFFFCQKHLFCITTTAISRKKAALGYLATLQCRCAVKAARAFLQPAFVGCAFISSFWCALRFQIFRFSDFVICLVELLQGRTLGRQARKASYNCCCLKPFVGDSRSQSFWVTPKPPQPFPETFQVMGRTLHHCQLH